MDRSLWQNIYIASDALNTISQKYFTNWSVLDFVFESDKKEGGKKTRKGKDFISLQDLSDGLIAQGDVSDLIKTLPDKGRQLISGDFVYQIVCHLADDIRLNAKPLASVPMIKGAPTKELKDEVRIFGERAVALDAVLRYFVLEKKRVSIFSEYPQADTKFYADLDEVRLISKSFYQTSASALDEKLLAQDDAAQKEYELMQYAQLKSSSIYGSMYQKAYKSKYQDDKTRLADHELVERIKALLKTKEVSYPQLKIAQSWKLPANEFATKLGQLASSLYSLRFDQKISDQYLKKLQSGHEPKLFVFLITNRDLRNNTPSHQANIHTTMFRQLFEPDSSALIVVKIILFTTPL